MEKLGLLLREKGYVKLVVSSLICRFADAIDVLVYSWMTYAITGSVTNSSIVYAANQIPTVVIQPIAGTIVEKLNKKSVYIVSNAIRSFIIMSAFALLFVGKLSFPYLVISTFLVSTVEAFNSPASMALVPLLLRKELFGIAVSASASLNVFAQLLGTVLGGLIIGLYGIQFGLAVDGLLFLISAIVVGFIKIESAKDEKTTNIMKNFKSDFSQGISYITKNKAAVDFCIIAFLINFAIVPLNSLQSPLADMIYNSGSELISVIGVMLIIGNCIGPIIGNAIKEKNSATVYLSCGLGIGGFVALFSLGKYILMNHVISILYCGAVSLLLGILLSILSTVLTIKLVESVAQGYLARTSSVMNAIGCLANPSAALLISLLTTTKSIEVIFIIWGIICITSFLVLHIKETFVKTVGD